MILTGFILDLITWLTLYPGGRSVEGVTQLLHYYETPYFWITVLLVIIVSIIMGAYEYKSK